MLNTTYVLLCCLTFIVAYFLWKWKTYADSLPPGPTAWPIVGNLLQLDQNDPRKTFVKWHKKYGPIYTVWLAMEPYIFITGYDLMQELFVKRGDEFTDRPYSFLMEHFTKGKYGIINAAGDQWKDQRRFSLQTLRNFGFGRKVMEQKVETEASKLVALVYEQLGIAEQKTLNFKPLLDACVSNIISSVAFGRSYSPKDSQFIRLKRGLDEFMTEFAQTSAMMLNCFPFLRFVPIVNRQIINIQIAIDNFFGILQDEVKEHKKELDNNFEPTDFTAAYLQEMKRRTDAGEDLGHFGDWQLVCILGDLWSAGMETTVTTLSWAILLMMNYPDVQKKVQNEIQLVIGSERSPTMNDRIQMPYTNAVIQELQRYANILPVNLARTVSQDTQIEGYTIPKGIGIVPQISVVLRDETLFTNPETFSPDRFIESDGITLKKSEYVIPFSLGKRICLGESLARMELFLIFTLLLQRFTFSFDENELKPNLNPKTGFTMAPHSYNVSIKRR